MFRTDRTYIPKMLLLASLLFVALSSQTLPAAAQNSGVSLSQTFTSADGSITFAYPDGWFVQPAPQSSGIMLANSEDAFLNFQGLPDQVLIVLTVDAIGAFPMPPGTGPATTPRELIAANRQVFADLATDAFKVSEIEEFTLGTFPGAGYAMTGGSALAYYAVALDDEVTAQFMVSSAEATLEQWKDVVFDIALTITVNPMVTAAIVPLPVDGALPLAQAYVAPDNSLAFDYPDGWQVALMPTMLEGTLPVIVLGSTPLVMSKSPGADGLQPDEVQVQIIAGDTVSLLRPMVEIAPDSTPAEILQAFLALNPNPPEVEIVETPICAHPAARVDIDQGALRSVALVIDRGSGQAVFFAASIRSDVADVWEPTLQAIAASIRFAPEPQPCDA